MIEPGRINAYLQAACAGLGFDIGEVWFSPNETSEPIPNPGYEKIGYIGDEILSTLKKGRSSERSRKIKFLQLYTSKSYNNRRNDLLRPASGECEDTQKHVLSPDVVDVISSTAQVVWAHFPERKGLHSRPDMCLQTAVGMPVAVDSDGSMCVVVMFSARHMRSNQNAMDYLKLFWHTAKSPSIPCLLPVVDSNNKKLVYSPQRFSDWQDQDQDQKLKLLSGYQGKKRKKSYTEIPTNHEVTSAPKDPYGIPILPSTAELDITYGGEKVPSPLSEDLAYAFDQASYDVWSTIMNMPCDDGANAALEMKFSMKSSQSTCPPPTATTPKSSAIFSLTSSCNTLLLSGERSCTPPERGDRLEEFASAFLGMSVFDLADVWIPDLKCNGDVGLNHLRSVSVAGRNEDLNYLMQVSQNSVIKARSGVIGKAYNSGNPIWGTNQDIIFDRERAEAFTRANVKTMLAVPIYSPNNANPCGVFCCYSLIRNDQVPFLLNFVQQALRTLWMGLDHVEPNKTIDKDLWKDVAPADLGEMAADIEMQKAFYQKKGTIIDASVKSQNSGIPPPADYGDVKWPSSKSSLSLDHASLHLSYEESELFLLKSKRGINAVDLAKKVVRDHLIGKLDVQAHQKLNSFQQSSHVNDPIIPCSKNGEGYLPTDRGTKRPHMESSALVRLETSLDKSSLDKGPSSVHEGDQHQLQMNTSVQPKKKTIGTISPNHPVVIPSSHKEDPDIAMGNIHEFNALVRNSKNQSQCEELVHLGKKYVLVKGVEECISPVETLSLSSDHNIKDSDAILQDTVQFTSKSIFLQNQINPSLLGAAAIKSSNNTVCLPVSPGVKISGKRCRIVGCTEISISRRPYCHHHSGNRLCEHLSCSKCAQGATRFCIAHGGGRRCTYVGCDKGARDKYFCAAHGGGRRCKSDGCSKSAVGGSNLCTSHGGGRRCAVDGCGKSAQSSTKFCVKHGGGKKCTFNGCDKVARGRTSFCAGHGGGVRCKLDGCNRIAIGKLTLCRTHGGGLKKTPSSVLSSTIESNQISLTTSLMPQTTRESYMASNLPRHSFYNAP